MLTLLFIVCMFLVFGNILKIAIKLAWGITKIVFSVIFLPLIIVGVAIAGSLYIAFGILLIVGVISLLGNLLAA